MLTATRPHPAGGMPTATLPDLLHAARQRAGDAVAVVDGDVRMSWADLAGAAAAFAAGLEERGVRAGDVVLVQLPNWWESVVACWGTWLSGGVVLPVVPIYRAHELGFIVDQIGPAAVVTAQTYRGYEHARELRSLVADRDMTVPVIATRTTQPGGEDAFDRLVEGSIAYTEPVRSADDIALVLYTSGTTASPKGALHSHRTLLAESASIRDGCRLGSGDRVFMPSPLGHITGLCYAVVLPADVGARAVLLDRWDPAAAVDLIESEDCTFTVSATPFLRGLTEEYDDRELGRSRLNTFICGGADIPPDLVRRARQVLGAAVVRTYGSTEMPTLAMTDPLDADAGATDEGAPIGANEMDLRSNDDGVEELVCRGPELFVGYVDAALNDDSFTPDGYFRTGDAAVLDNGVLRITGRIKDIINRGGEKYSTSEVEWELLSHPLVAEIAIVGFPDDVLGERACAFVVPADDEAPTLGDLRDHLGARGFAVQKSPERLEIVAALPRTVSGKVQKFRLRHALGCETTSENRSEVG